MNAAALSSSTLQATRAFAVRVAKAYPSQESILFGRRARGTEHEESDADVAVILKSPPGNFIKTKMAMNDIAYDILLDTGIRIQPLPVWEGEWAHPELYSNPHLLHNIAVEGITL
jgi:predicted nucleotidyltransferase